jgi:oxygen-independent coproporphyrinogen III oxidase
MMQNELSTVDVELLQRYDKPGPRYTSYPTAPLFSPAYDAKRFEVDLITNNDDNLNPISLYLHIPFCDTLCYFCGCTTMITSDRGRISQYLGTLKKEIARTTFYLNRRRPVVQMHWGGGTPSYLTPSEIEDLSSFIGRRLRFDPEAEISVEIDPRGLTFDHLKAFRNSGVNRISLGVQDFTERVQQAVHRVQPESLTRQTLEWSRTLGINHVNIDLIYGLPLQTLGTFQQTLDKVVDLSPGRIAVFNFAYVPWMKPHQKLIHPEDLPSPETKLQLLKATIETLTKADYEYIGMDHFAKPDDEMARAQRAKQLHRNFQGYSTRAGADLFAFGMSAISHFGNVYAQNEKTLKEYTERVERGEFPTHVGYRMNTDDEIRKHVIMRLMCDLEISKINVEKLYGISFDSYFASSLGQLGEYIEAGLVSETEDRVRVVGNGRLFLRNIAMCFDAYLKSMKKENIFSRTV